jgi:hypothetical protein
MFYKTTNLVVTLLLLPFLGEYGEAFSFHSTSVPSDGVGNTTTRKNFLQSSGLALTAFLIPQKSMAVDEVGGKIRFGNEEIMSQKEHGTSAKPVQSDLKFGVNNRLADKICNFNR